MDIRRVDPCRTDSDVYTSEPLIRLHWFGGIGMIAREKSVRVGCQPFWVQSTGPFEPRAVQKPGHNHGNATYIKNPTDVGFPSKVWVDGWWQKCRTCQESVHG